MAGSKNVLAMIQTILQEHQTERHKGIERKYIFGVFVYLRQAFVTFLCC